MRKNQKIKESFSWPKSILVLLTFVFNMALAAYAEDSNYYDVSDSTRPPSAFSICCCSKQSNEGFQAIYTCNHIEDEKCPLNTQQYKTTTGDCPSNLIITKYAPEQNKDSEDNYGER